MGGDFEKSFVPPKTQKGGITRSHISQGECHLHDDKNGKKCAVDVADMVAIWDDFKLKMAVGDTKEVVSKDGMTTATIKKVRTKDGALEAEISVSDQKVGSNWQKIEDMLTGK